MASTRSLLDQNQLERAEKNLKRLATIIPQAETETLAQAELLQKRLKELRAANARRRRELTRRMLDKRLTEGEAMMNRGDYEAATTALNDVLKRGPTPGQRQLAGEIARQIETRRKSRRELGAYLQMLASNDRSQFRAAQLQLSRRADEALPLLLEKLKASKQTVEIRNTLELLRRIRRPAMTLPAIVGVLRRTDVRPNWPHAIRELGKIDAPGAGQLLLDLAVSSADAQQQIATLTALAAVVDPPRNTLVSLLPMLHADGPQLAAALTAAARAVEIHKQNDLIARRGIGTELSEQTRQQLAALPKRLDAIIAARGKKAGPQGDAADSAQVLALATRLHVSKPLTGIKVISFGGEMKESPAAAIVDGIRDATEPKTMWRYPLGKRDSVILDLGSERTIVGVRIWNLNEPGGTQRGWKEVEIFTGNETSSMTRVANGVVPPAPGAVKPPDYSTTISLPFARGRYVRLRATSLWSRSSHSGLTEVQILGF